MFRSESQKK
jgi:hypothetical protein